MPGSTLPPVLDTVHGLRATAKPRILSCASPAVGHTVPVLRVSEALVERGYDVTMIAGVEFSDTISKFGARPVVVEPLMTDEFINNRRRLPIGPEQFLYDITMIGINPTKCRKEALYSALEMMHEEDPDSDIVIITETLYLGTNPMYLGADLPRGFTKRPRVINLHALCYFIKSINTGPVGPGMLPDSSEEGREKFAKLRADAMENDWAPLLELNERNMRSLGAVNYMKDGLWDIWSTCHDITLQMCPPSLEFDRPDWHPKVHFIGALPPKPVKEDQVYPPFWDEITSGNRRLVIVSQGTIATSYSQLITPTIQALADRDDLYVVALLGIKGATLPTDDNFKLPSNAFVLDYFPYDTLLPHASVFVFNGGYGGFIHGAINGVPMVLAGVSEEKPEVSARGEYCGLAVNLRTSDPTTQQLSEAVSKVLSDPSYKKKASQIMRENNEMRATDAVESAVLKMAALGPA